MSDEAREQQLVHDMLEPALRGVEGMLADNEALTGWVICFEKLGPDNRAHACRLYGPAGMTSWRALGLTEYVSRTDGFREGIENGDDE